jgi:N-acetylneuraminic acid mutarotase
MNLALLIVLSLSSFILCAQDLVFMRETASEKTVEVLHQGNIEVIANGPAWNLYPDISSDGNFVTFVRGIDDKTLSLYLYDRSSKKLNRLISDEGLILHPRFAKGANLIFYSAPDLSGKNQIMMLNRVMSTPIKTKLTNDEAAFFPVPSSDASLLTYQRNTGSKREIILLSMADLSSEVIDDGMAPAFSKDDRFIAYTKKVNGNWDIHVYDRHQKKIKKVTSDAANDFAPSFDHLGNILFASNRGESDFALYRLDLKSWNLAIDNSSLLLKDLSSSFYAPKMSGLIHYKLNENASIPGTSRSSFGAVTHKNKIYIAGGHQGQEHTYPPESFTGRVQIYDIATKSWKDAAPRINPCHGFSLAAYGNYIYAFGGFAYDDKNIPKWKSLDVIERYSIQDDRWEEIGKMPRRRSSNVVAQVGSKVFLMGGWDSTPKFANDLDGKFHDEVDLFDLETETMVELPVKIPTKRRAMSSVVDAAGNIYLIGGISEGASHFNLLGEITKFDPKSLSFEELAPLPFATFAPAAGLLNGKIYIFGGMFKTGNFSYEYVPHIYEFDLLSKAWINTGRYLKESKGFSQVVDYPNGLGILGGHSYENNADAPVATFETFFNK